MPVSLYRKKSDHLLTSPNKNRKVKTPGKLLLNKFRPKSNLPQQKLLPNSLQVKSDADSALLASEEETKIRLNEQIQDLNDTLGNFVIESENTSNLIYQISGISNEIELKAFQITPTGQNISAFDNCKYISGQLYHVGFIASFNQFATFLNALERYRPVIFIDTFSITRSRQGENSHTVDMQLAILVLKNEKAKKAKG